MKQECQPCNRNVRYLTVINSLVNRSGYTSSINEYKCVQGFGRRRLWLTPGFLPCFVGRQKERNARPDYSLVFLHTSGRCQCRRWPDSEQAGRCSQLMETNNYSTSELAELSTLSSNYVHETCSAAVRVKRQHSLLTYFF